MSWMKRDEPGKGPPPPPRTDLISLHRFANEAVLAGPLPPDVVTLLKAAPPLQLDRWGMPLPLSANQQAALDRIAAILASPLLRGRQLLVAGQLGPDEVQAIVDARPAAYAVLVQQATHELLAVSPPIAPWAEAQLAILFGRPTGAVIAEPETEEQQRATGGGGGGRGPVPYGTPAERREVAVRQGERR